MTTELHVTIGRLVWHLGPVTRLSSPSRRTALWLIGALPSVAAMVHFFSIRPDLSVKALEIGFVLELGAAFVTAIVAAWSAFAMTVPGYDRRYLIWPIGLASAWMASLLGPCIRDVMAHGWTGIRFEADWVCLPMIAVLGAWPAVLLAVMLQRGAPLAPVRTIAMGAFASAALGDVGLQLFHVQDESLAVFVWQLGSALLLSWLAARAGHLILKWPTERLRKRLLFDQPPL